MTETERVLPIVVGIDGSTAAVRAAQWAAEEASRWNVPVVLLHVLLRHSTSESVFGAPGIDRDYAANALDSAAEWIAASGSTATVEKRTVTGSPTSALIEASKSAAMVVVGSIGKNSFAEMWLGSTAASLAESAQCPAVIVRGPAGAGAVVVGLGPRGAESAGSEPDVVVSEAFRAASMAGCSIVGVRAVHAPNLVDPAAEPVFDSLADIEVADRMARAGRAYPDVRIDTTVIEGSSVTELVALSERARLVVVGHEHGRSVGRTLGALLRFARCPVMVVQHS